jgi:hypothetical protein
MPPIDPNQPPQNPGQNPANQPLPKLQVDKLRFEDVFDVAQIQDQMKRVFRISPMIVEENEKKAAEIHLKYLKVIQTAERHKHTVLLKEKKDLIKMLDEELKLQKKIQTEGLTKREARGIHEGLEKQHAEKVQKVETAYKPQLAAQSLRALASEGSGVLGGMAGKLAGFIELLPKLGTAMGAMSGIVTGLLAVFKLGTERLADLTKLQAQLRAGGQGLGESARSVEAAQKAFHALGQDRQVLGQSADDVNKLVSELSKAPDALRELTKEGGPEAWKAIRDAMSKFGIDASTVADMVTNASKTQNMSMEEVGKMFMSASDVATEARINFKDAFNGLININAEMRNLTFNTDEARKIFTSTYISLRKLGDTKFSAADAQKFAASFSSALGSMTIEKLTGILSFVKGRMPSEDELAEGLGFNDVMKFFDKIMGGTFTSKDSSAMNKIAKGMETLGINMGDNPVMAAKEMQLVLTKWKASVGTETEKVTKESLEKEMKAREEQARKAAAAFKKAQEEGFAAQKQMVPPLNKLATAMGTFAVDFVDTFMPQFSSFANNFDKFVKIMTFDSLTKNKSPGTVAYEAGMDESMGVKYRSSIERNMTQSVRARRRAQAHSRPAALAEQFKGL